MCVLFAIFGLVFGFRLYKLWDFYRKRYCRNLRGFRFVAVFSFKIGVFSSERRFNIIRCVFHGILVKRVFRIIYNIFFHQWQFLMICCQLLFEHTTPQILSLFLQITFKNQPFVSNWCLFDLYNHHRLLNSCFIWRKCLWKWGFLGEWGFCFL